MRVSVTNETKKIGLASQANHQNTTNVRIPSVALQSSRQNAITFTLKIESASAAVGQWHDAINVGASLQTPLPVEMLGNIPGDGRRTIYRANDRNIVARPHAAISA